MKRVDWKYVILSIIIVALNISLSGNIATGVNSPWYQENKPSITPPDYIFPIAWTILYVLIAISLYLAFISKKSKDRKILIGMFIANLIFNGVWSLLFFKLRIPALAFADLILIWITIVGILFYSWKVNRKITYMIIPYFVWVSYAGLLNYLFI